MEMGRRARERRGACRRCFVMVRLKNMVVSHTTTAREWWWTVNARVVESRKVLSRKDRTEFARKWWWTVNATGGGGRTKFCGEKWIRKRSSKLHSLSVKVAPVLVRDLSPSIY